VSERAASIAAAAALSVIAVSPFLILPLFVEGVVQDLHYTQSQVGYFSALVGLGSAISAIAAGIWVRRVPWRSAAWLALGGMVLASLVAQCFHDRGPFLLAMLLAGLAGGALYSLALTALSDGANPDRNFGISVAAQVAFQVAGLLLGPTLLRWMGINGLLLVIEAIGVLGSLLVRFLPPSGTRGAAADGGGRLLTPPMCLALCGCFLFYFNVGVYWTYIDLIGRAAGHDTPAVARSIALGVGFGLPGALLAAWLGERFGRVLPLALGAAMVVASVLLLRGTPDLADLTWSGVLYNFAWNYSLAYQYASVNALDGSGRAVAVSPALAAAGIAVGPAIAAPLVPGGDYTVVFWLTGAAAVASAIAFALSRLGESAAALADLIEH
jgi:predicted MFS family arabinose efflux permease